MLRLGTAPPPPAPVPPATLEAELDAAFKTPPVRWVARNALLVMLLTLGPLFAWGSLTTIQGAVLASGQLAPEGRRKTINLLEAGILRRLDVREGDVVRQGQPLLQLDVTLAEAAAEQARAAYWGGQARLARLRAELAEQRGLVFPDDLMQAVAANPALPVFLDAEQQLFRARWSAADGAVTVQERQINQFQEQLLGATAQREASQLQLRSAQDQVVSLQQLLVQGFASRFKLLELQRTESGYNAAIGSFAAQEAQLREAVIQARATLATLRLNRLAEAATDTQATEALVATAAQQLRATQDTLQRRVVVAPEAGKVTNIRAFTPGSSIAATDPVLDLVPLRDRFVAEVQVMPVDIEEVRVGQPVNVRLLSNRVRRLPVIPGRVIQVGADVQTLPGVPGFFQLRAELDLDAMPGGLPEGTLTAGMPVEAYVLGETRTPLGYFWGPIRSSARRAFRTD